MSSISFFTPIVYNSQIKTKAQRALEVVDEYFYFGNTLRVTIFAPDATHLQSYALRNRQGYYRSWKNIAIKIVSYFTLFLPMAALIAKVLLRCCLKVSSIQVRPQFVANRVEDKLPVYVLQKIGSFLSFQDQDQLAQVAHFTHDAAHKTQLLTASLKAEVDALPRGSFASTNNKFQQLLVKLITSPAAGHSKHWVSVMDALMRHVSYNETGDGIIRIHGEIAGLLVRAKQPISSDQIYQFCKYLGRNKLRENDGPNELSNWRPWVSYRALEIYSLQPKLNFMAINRYLKEFLTQKAEILIVARNCKSVLSNYRKLHFCKIDIDPRQWFGVNVAKYSLWNQPYRSLIDYDETAPMPELLLEVLWTHIQTLRISCMDKPFIVSMRGRPEARLPHHFTLKLAQRITNAGIFLEHNNTIDIKQLENPRYAQDFNPESGAIEYPQAVKLRRTGRE